MQAVQGRQEQDQQHEHRHQGLQQKKHVVVPSEETPLCEVSDEAGIQNLGPSNQQCPSRGMSIFLGCPSRDVAQTFTELPRILQLHALHDARLRRLEIKRVELEAEEMRQITEEKDAVFTRCATKPGKAHPQETVDRLYSDHKAAEQRRALLRERFIQEETEKLEESRFRNRGQRKCAHAATSVVHPGPRLYEDHRCRELEKRTIDKDAAKFHQGFSETESAAPAAAMDGISRFELLYEDATHRRKCLDQKLREKEATEIGALEKQTASQRVGPVDMNRLEQLHLDHMIKQAKRMALVTEALEQERQDNKDKIERRRKRDASEQKPIWQRGGTSAYFRGADKASTQPDKKVAPKLVGRADVVFAAVLRAVALRCVDGAVVDDAKLLLPPLRCMLDLYSEAQATCKRSEGYSALCVRASQRLFSGCYLIPEFEGFEQCRDPSPVHQVQEDLDILMATAADAQVALQNLFEPLVRPQLLRAYDPGPKSKDVAELKALVRYGAGEAGRRCRHLLDLARLALVFPNCDMLQSGLEVILNSQVRQTHLQSMAYEIVQVQNRFASPTRLGERFVQVLVVLPLERDDGSICPHVCELKLEVQSFHHARLQALPYLQEFERQLRNVLHRALPSSNTNALVYSARVALAQAPESHGLRVFRQQLAQVFSSITSAWRRMGHGRSVSFQQFRELCQSVKCREMAPVYWCELNPGAGGCISLFDLDPEASSLLARARFQLLSANGSGMLEDRAILERLSLHSSNSWLEGPKAEKSLKALGVRSLDIHRVLQNLDLPGDFLAPPGSLSAGDVRWLLRLDSMLHLDAVLLGVHDEMARIERPELSTLQTATLQQQQQQQQQRCSLCKTTPEARAQQTDSKSEGSTADASSMPGESDDGDIGDMSHSSDEITKHDGPAAGMGKHTVDRRQLADVP